MSVIDEVLEANEIYARTHELRPLTPRPGRKLAILTCMDTRLYIPTPGGILTDASLRSLLVSHYSLGTREIMVINHTDCGLMHTTEKELREKIEKHTGVKSASPEFFFAFKDVEENVRQQIQKLHAHPWTSEEFPARGFVYDVTTGRLREVV